MISRRKLASFGAMGAVALSLIGAGAGASFTDNVQAHQNIAVGTADLQIVRSVDCITGDEGITPASEITYNLVVNSSSFDVCKWIKVANVGTMPMHALKTYLIGTDHNTLGGAVQALVGDWFIDSGLLSVYTETGTVDTLENYNGGTGLVLASDYTVNTAGSGTDYAWFMLQFHAVNLPNSVQGTEIHPTLKVEGVDGTGADSRWPADPVYGDPPFGTMPR